jgi:UDP-2-acetamido-3-amino-2,3-dideoxy-glucuronate N-acetyltransferase
MSDIKIGLVGAGQWGKNYVRNLAQLGVLGAVCDTSVERLAGFAAEYPDAYFTTDLAELAARPDIAGCIVATPTEHHFHVAHTLLTAGKSCLVEKPLTDAPETARELCERAEAGGLTFMVGHILLYHPAIEHIKGLLERGELGDVYYIAMTRAKLGTIRRHENVMWSFAPHDISVVQYLLGDAPATVSASGASFVTPGIEDVTQLSLTFPGGTMASIVSSWLDPERVNLIKVVGSKASVVFNDVSKELTLHELGVDWESYSVGAAASRPADGGKLPPPLGSSIPVRSGDSRKIELDPAEPLRRECEEFVRCIRERAAPRSSGRQGYANVQILAAADESLRRGGATVTLDEVLSAR